MIWFVYLRKSSKFIVRTWLSIVYPWILRYWFWYLIEFLRVIFIPFNFTRSISIFRINSIYWITESSNFRLYSSCTTWQICKVLRNWNCGFQLLRTLLNQKQRNLCWHCLVTNLIWNTRGPSEYRACKSLHPNICWKISKVQREPEIW